MTGIETNLRKRYPNLPSRPLFIVLLLVFLKQLGNGMVWSVIAVYGQSLGASASVIGLMVSSYGGARLIVNFPAGYASEKFGRKRMMAAGCLLLAASSIGVVFTNSLGAFFVCLLVMGTASSIYVTSALAAVADLGTAGRRVQDMSYYQGANTIGVSMGPARGGLAIGMWSFGAPFTINAIVGICGFFAFAFMPWPQREEIPEKSRSTPAQFRAIARQGIWVGIINFSLFYTRISSNWILMPLIAQARFQLEISTIGLILTSGAFANLCILPFTARIASRIGRVGAIVTGSTITLAACALLAFAPNPWFVWIASIMFGMAGGIVSPTLTAYVADIAPADQRGPAMGLLRTTQDLAMISGPFLTGVLSDHLGYGYQGGLFGCLVLLAVATLVFRWGTRAEAAER